ncbi:hypothetical protein [Cysteiniphilum marinum]|uniref:hypothetical protein n=1 Tax=Cysteiniphilum marinum TaxID=2774191 RepID=UPI00193BA174|nr:hypothetical protein [Cysteiniphilum marinum]
MQRIQVMLDDNLAVKLKQKAHEAGLSISSYTRILLNDKLSKKKLSVMDQAMLDLNNSEDDQVVSLKELKDELAAWIKNADR